MATVVENVVVGSWIEVCGGCGKYIHYEMGDTRFKQDPDNLIFYRWVHCPKCGKGRRLADPNDLGFESRQGK